MIGSEIAASRKYILQAVKNRDENRQLADVFYQLSTEEMNHMQMLHKEVVKIIEEYRKEKGEPPKEMLAVYDYLHEKHIEKAAEVKAMQAFYQER